LLYSGCRDHESKIAVALDPRRSIPQDKNPGDVTGDGQQCLAHRRAMSNDPPGRMRELLSQCDRAPRYTRKSANDLRQ
jgi:hypothetical protein